MELTKAVNIIEQKPIVNSVMQTSQKLFSNPNINKKSDIPAAPPIRYFCLGSALLFAAIAKAPTNEPMPMHVIIKPYPDAFWLSSCCANTGTRTLKFMTNAADEE